MPPLIAGLIVRVWMIVALLCAVVRHISYRAETNRLAGAPQELAPGTGGPLMAFDPSQR